MGVFDFLRKPKPPAPSARPTVVEEPPVDNLGGGGDMSPEAQREAVERWNEQGRKQKAERAEVERKRAEQERKAREKSERGSRLHGLLAKVPPIFRLDRTEGPLLSKYGPVDGWPWPGFTPMATPLPSSAEPDGVAEHRRRIRRYESLPSDSDEREDIGENCWSHGGMDTAAKACPRCYPGLKRRRQREEERKQRGSSGFAFAFHHAPQELREPRADWKERYGW